MSDSPATADAAAPAPSVTHGLFDLPADEPGEEATLSNDTAPYLTFALARRRYAIPMATIRELAEVQPVTPVHDMPPYLLGIINLRGHVVPVVDASIRLGEGPCTVDDRTCIVILDVDGHEVGVMVERVGKVYDVSQGEIEPRDGHLAGGEVTGIGDIEGVPTIFLNTRWLVQGSPPHD